MGDRSPLARFEPVLNVALVALGLPHMVGERGLQLRMSCDLPRAGDLDQRLQLDRVDVGQVNAQLLLEVVRYGGGLPRSAAT